MPDHPLDTCRGYTPRELARRWRVSPARIRAWIAAGELVALDLSPHRCSARRRLTITPEAVADFERGRIAATPPRPKRRKTIAAVRDYYPD